jgi:hypothetical protein
VANATWIRVSVLTEGSPLLPLLCIELILPRQFTPLTEQSIVNIEYTPLDDDYSVIITKR